MPKRQYQFIDAVRGIAILGVFACHLAGHLPGAPAGLLKLLGQGGIGVQLFFIASALTLFLSLEARSASEANPTLNFFIRRFFRIAPLFYLGAAFYAAYSGGNTFDTRVPSRLTWGSFLSTLTFTNGWSVPWINQVVPGGWSIAVEMNFYLLVPFCFARLKSLRACLAAAIVVYLLGLAASHVVSSRLDARYGTDGRPMLEAFVTYWLPAQLYRFFMGFALFYALRRELAGAPGPADSNVGRRRAALLLAGSAVLLGLAFAVRLPAAASKPMVTLALAAFVGSLALHPNRALVNRATGFVGKVSFSAYVTHFAAISVLESAARALGIGPERVPWPVWLAGFGGAALVLTLLVSAATHRWIEVPGQALGKRLIAALESRRSASPVPLP